MERKDGKVILTDDEYIQMNKDISCDKNYIQRLLTTIEKLQDSKPEEVLIERDSILSLLRSVAHSESIGLSLRISLSQAIEDIEDAPKVEK
jgi:hypothetical protein